MAPTTRMAFSKASRVSTFDSTRSSRTMSTMRRPDSWASLLRRESAAGNDAFSGRVTPNASAKEAMVEAVPMVLQWPAERDIPLSASRKACGEITPARASSDRRHTSVPEPSTRPWYRPESMGPPESRIVGTSQLAAPISREGVVLSHPASSTTPSMGLARIASSTSIDARLRNSMAVGRRLDSPQLKTGNSSGKPPAS